MLSFLKHFLDQGFGERQAFDQQSAQTYIEQFEATGEPDDLAIAAMQRGNRSMFVQLLAQRGMWVVIRLDQGEFEGDIRLLEYEENDRLVLPVFSSLMEASAFVHTVDLTEMLPLQYIHVTAALLTHNDLSGRKVVMNPFAGATTEIQDPDVQALKMMFQDL